MDLLYLVYYIRILRERDEELGADIEVSLNLFQDVFEGQLVDKG